MVTRVRARSRRAADSSVYVNHPRRVTFSIARSIERRSEWPSLDSASEVWRDNAGLICARGIAGTSFAWIEFPGTANFRFDRARQAITAIPEPTVEDDVVRDTYFRAALPLALQYFGVEVLHASAVRTRSGIVAFCAISETGKSTTVAALSCRGYPIWADDAVPIEIDVAGNGAHALAVPFRLRVAPGALRGISAGNAALRWPEPGGLEFAPTPVAALCVMRRVSRTKSVAEVQRLTPVEALTELLPHAYCFTLAEPGRKREMMSRYIELAARVPTYAISIASGLEKLPEALLQIEKSIPGFAPPDIV